MGMFFQSNRDGEGLYVLPLQKEPARSADAYFKFEKPKSKVNVAIDFDGIAKRIRKIASQNPSPGGPPSPVTPHLGFTFDYSYQGQGIEKTWSTGTGSSACVNTPNVTFTAEAPLSFP